MLKYKIWLIPQSPKLKTPCTMSTNVAKTGYIKKMKVMKSRRPTTHTKEATHPTQLTNARRSGQIWEQMVNSSNNSTNKGNNSSINSNNDRAHGKEEI